MEFTQNFTTKSGKWWLLKFVVHYGSASHELRLGPCLPQLSINPPVHFTAVSLCRLAPEPSGSAALRTGERDQFHYISEVVPGRAKPIFLDLRGKYFSENVIIGCPNNTVQQLPSLYGDLNVFWRILEIPGEMKIMLYLISLSPKTGALGAIVSMTDYRKHHSYSK